MLVTNCDYRAIFLKWQLTLTLGGRQIRPCAIPNILSSEQNVTLKASSSAKTGGIDAKKTFVYYIPNKHIYKEMVEIHAAQPVKIKC